MQRFAIVRMKSEYFKDVSTLFPNVLPPALDIPHCLHGSPGGNTRTTYRDWGRWSHGHRPLPAPVSASPQQPSWSTREKQRHAHVYSSPVGQNPDHGYMPPVSSVGGQSQELPQLTPRCPLSSQHSDAGAASPGSGAGQSCEPSDHQPALSDNRTGMGTDWSGGGGLWESGRQGVVGVAWPGGGGAGRLGGWQGAQSGWPLWVWTIGAGISA